MRAYVGVTDEEWYRFLRARRATEANFWFPSGRAPARGLETGTPFLFKSKAPRNAIVGGGFVSSFVHLPVSEAWDFFGEDNGTASAGELHGAIARYRRRTGKPAEPDPEIGCLMLRDVTWLDEAEELPQPPDWSATIVTVKGYDLEQPSGSYIEDVLEHILARSAALPLDGSDGPGRVAGEVFAERYGLSRYRVGQKAFGALVQEAYERRCAVTGDRIRPVLEAAHIRPVTANGENRVDNGLLLRSDVHTLFDRGYLGVHPERRTLIVSARLRREFGNGEEFYARERSAEPIALPERAADRPNSEFLTWHMDEVFRG